ncbi:hypothetical protein CSUB01_11401 [Colletotrichum sublineola]|uniref:Uncharacterized protein n=1 Tax=Colletotrichum sublineola TaxID=1173701 RepID=A0A066XVI6_COLSU|nr:hypothetical protein CSUB01_11401 [Colletotrichum sublineola]
MRPVAVDGLFTSDKEHKLLLQPLLRLATNHQSINHLIRVRPAWETDKTTLHQSNPPSVLSRGDKPVPTWTEITSNPLSALETHERILQAALSSISYSPPRRFQPDLSIYPSPKPLLLPPLLLRPYTKPNSVQEVIRDNILPAEYPCLASDIPPSPQTHSQNPRRISKVRKTPHVVSPLPHHRVRRLLHGDRRPLFDILTLPTKNFNPCQQLPDSSPFPIHDTTCIQEEVEYAV